LPDACCVGPSKTKCRSVKQDVAPVLCELPPKLPLLALPALVWGTSVLLAACGRLKRASELP
jgi:hypothetical protein